MTKLYREFATQEEIDAAYNPTGTVADPDAVFRSWIARSAATAAELSCRLGVKYGPTRAEYCDVFPAGAGAPIHVFVHGGYWRRFSARDHDFVARPLVAAGITTVVMNYALCPSVTLEEIVRQTRASIVWAFTHAAKFGADPDRLTVSGHSAGGHLVAMAAATDWAGDYDLPSDIVKGIISISGIFDLGFVPYSYLQPKVQASWDQVERLSPQRHLPSAAPPLLIAVGGNEPAEFRRQSRDYHAALGAAGLASTYLEPEGRNHLSVLEELERSGSPLSEAVITLAHGR